ncbi:MAG: bile acid:sodium symporter [Gammaproteobacteria bacterium]|jgi:BASS family bile acid:Na+ symporter
MVTLTAKILAFIFAFFSMLAIGMNVKFQNISSLLEKKILLLKSLTTNIIIIPVFTALLITLIPMPPHVTLAFIILAFMPGGLSAIQFASKISGESTYAGLMTCLFTIYTLFISPLLITLFTPSNIILNFPYLNMFIILVLLILLPLFAGIFLQYKKIKIINAIGKISALIGTVAFLGMIIETFDMRGLAIKAHSIKIIIAMLIFILGSMLIGWLMGGPNKNDRKALAIVTSMRNVAIALLMAVETIPTAKVITPLIALGALMVLPNMLFTLITLIFSKK